MMFSGILESEIKHEYTGIETADDVAARATQVGANTVIDLGNGDSITLNNVDAEDIQDDPDSFFSVQ